MNTIVVVSDPADWPEPDRDLQVVLAREYMTEPSWGAQKNLRVINLCRSMRYQKAGYYTSLLAKARRHRVLPDLTTIQELKGPTIARMATAELEEDIQKTFGSRTHGEFSLKILFGQCSDASMGRLASALFRRFPAPILEAVFQYVERNGKWVIANCNLQTPTDLSEDERARLPAAYREYQKKRHRVRRDNPSTYDLAILRDPGEAEPPSNEAALKKFVKAAESWGFDVELIDKYDYGRVAEFDALFIRETTAVNHRTYRFAQRAAASGLVVIDDPESILRCTNKVFLAEALARAGIAMPPTMILHRGNVAEVRERIGLPIVLKQPDSSFSQGVVKATTEEQYREHADKLLRRSDMVVAQAYVPTDFDWRIGVIGGQAFYACKYFMARHHWQIIKRAGERATPVEGRSEAVPLGRVPPAIVDYAVRACSLMGDGLYGVDLKEVDGRAMVIEVNDNPSIDAGYEDALLGDEIYLRIMAELRRRCDVRRPGP